MRRGAVFLYTSHRTISNAPTFSKSVLSNNAASLLASHAAPYLRISNQATVCRCGTHTGASCGTSFGIQAPAQRTSRSAVYVPASVVTCSGAELGIVSRNRKGTAEYGANASSCLKDSLGVCTAVCPQHHQLGRKSGAL